MAEEQQVEVMQTEEVAAPVGQMDKKTALQTVFKKASVHDGVAKGLRECVKALDRRQAHLCVLAKSCNAGEYVKLVEALCNEHNIPITRVNYTLCDR